MADSGIWTERKFWGMFGLLIKKPPLVMAAFETRGGFFIKDTTDSNLTREFQENQGFQTSTSYISELRSNF